MKNYLILLFALLVIPFYAVAQEEEPKKEKAERPAFECSTIIDNPSNVLFSKNTLEVMMQHRFDLIESGSNNLAGIYGKSNIRIGATYAFHERLTLGFGTTKDNRLQDFNWKVAILNQTRSNKMPVSVSYYGNFTIDARKKENFNLIQDRYSYFNQLIIAKRFSPKLSLQVAPSISHYNLVQNTMKNDMIAVSLGGRYKISNGTAIMVDYSQPITKFDNEDENPLPGLSLGVEFGTSAHAFQLFLTNYNGIVPQKNYMYNQNDFFNKEFLIGFNITRNYNF